MCEPKSSPTWQQPALELSQHSLQGLIAGSIPAILIKGFASLEECSALCSTIRRHADHAEDATTSRMTLIGVNFSNYAGETKTGYFDKVDPSYKALRPILAEAGFDPLERMIERLRAIWTADASRAQISSFIGRLPDDRLVLWS